MTTRKYPRSASGIARHLSRILRENGFEKAVIRNQLLREGFSVFRIGYSKTVKVDYYIENQSEINCIRRDSKVAQMREVLFELGYVSTHPHAIYIECRES